MISWKLQGTTDASSLDLAPGEWPDNVTVTGPFSFKHVLTKGLVERRENGDISVVNYYNADMTVKVYND